MLRPHDRTTAVHPWPAATCCGHTTRCGHAMACGRPMGCGGCAAAGTRCAAATTWAAATLWDAATRCAAATPWAAAPSCACAPLRRRSGIARAPLRRHARAPLGRRARAVSTPLARRACAGPVAMRWSASSRIDPGGHHFYVRYIWGSGSVVWGFGDPLRWRRGPAGAGGHPWRLQRGPRRPTPTDPAVLRHLGRCWGNL